MSAAIKLSELSKQLDSLESEAAIAIQEAKDANSLEQIRVSLLDVH